MGKIDDLFSACFGALPGGEPSAPMARQPRSVGVDALAPYHFGYHDGDKFYGGYGPTFSLYTDYWTLRARSSELFKTNLYARAIIRRLITNELNTGLYLEATPEEAILGFAEDTLAEWTETVENLFSLWAKDPFLCDAAERQTFGALQCAARLEALVAGDVLVTLRQHQLTGLPRIQLISGSLVQSPLSGQPQRGNKIRHGVEIDPQGRHVAYWITQEDGSSKRLPAWGEKSGRRLAWLIYGTDKRLDDIRGEPILSLVLQSLKEIDRYRDSVQRKAVVLAMLALFIRKTEAKAGSRPFASGAQRRSIVETGPTDVAGQPRSFHASEHIPGIVIDELQHGEEPQAFQTQGTVEKFGEFEHTIVAAIAAALEIPPEILTLSFNSNYSASQAAINEFKTYVTRVRTSFGEQFCVPIYQEWMIAELLTQNIKAEGLLDAWRDPLQYNVFNAWMSSDWAGNIKPAVDPSKLIRGYERIIANGIMTRDRATRELGGGKYSKNVQRLKRENEQLAAALAPLEQMKAGAVESASNDEDDDENERDERLEAPLKRLVG